MRRFVDLHTHSSFSDGSMTPHKLLAVANNANLLAVALTDHDTTEGLSEARRAAGEFSQLRFVAGVEVSAKFTGGTLHILGLGIDESAAGIQKLASQLREARTERNPRIIARLQGLGLAISMDEVQAVAGGGKADRILGRLHIALAMVRRGLVRSVDEAFKRYIGAGRPAFIDKERLYPRQLIEAIHDSGGVAILAHPPQLKYANRRQLERIVRDLRSVGLDAIEVYHSDHSPQQTRQYLDIARRFALMVSGGSDFHGAIKPATRLGHPRVTATMIGELAKRLFD